MSSLGFENYAEALKIYLSKYREVSLLPLLGSDDTNLESIDDADHDPNSHSQIAATTSKTGRTVRDMAPLVVRTKPGTSVLVSRVSKMVEMPRHRITCTAVSPGITVPAPSTNAAMTMI
jgi:hypothetical protein